MIAQPALHSSIGVPIAAENGAVFETRTQLNDAGGHRARPSATAQHIIYMGAIWGASGRNVAEMNSQQKIAVAIVDILIIIELCLTMYLANSNPENFTLLFFKYFPAMFFPTFALGVVAVRKFRQKGGCLQTPA